LFRFLRLIIAAVKETGSVLRPRRAGELHPFENILGVLGGRYVADTPLFPVGTGRGEAVGHVSAVLADGITLERNGSILRKLVRVEQNSGRGVERIHGVKHALVLEPIVASDEVALALFERNA